MRAEWNRQSEEVSSGAEALNLLRRLISTVDVPTIVEFIDESTGRSLIIGVGLQKTIVQYKESYMPPYYVSVGDPTAKGVSIFNCGGSRTEIKNEYLIELNAALDVAWHYFEDGKRLDSISWKEI